MVFLGNVPILVSNTAFASQFVHKTVKGLGDQDQSTIVHQFLGVIFLGARYSLALFKQSPFVFSFCAGRFRQVEVLTAMANAFYSLYSHVSRTPLQKLAPPEFSFSSPTIERTIGQRFFGNVRTEPRSPVERLKDTVSKMCLYTRGSDSTSPNYSPRKRNSMPDVAEIMENVRGDAIHDSSRRTCIQDGNVTRKVKDEKTAEKISDHEKATSAHKQRIQRWSQSGQREGPRAKGCLFKSDHSSLDFRHFQNLWDADLDVGSTKSSLLLNSSKDQDETDALAPIITYDKFSCRVVEHVHKTPSGCSKRHRISATGLSTADHMHRQDSCRETLELEPKPNIMDTKSPPAQNKNEIMVEMPATSKVLQGNPVTLHPSVTQGSPCQIMVTGWEDDDSVHPRDATEDYTYFTYPGSTVQAPSSQLNQTYLSPSNLSTSQLKQANSFELEEVFSYPYLFIDV